MKRIFIFFSASVILLAGVFFLIPFNKNVQSEQTTDTLVEIFIPDLPPLLAVREVSNTEMIFSAAEWFTGEAATREAQKDGFSSAPNGFYLRVSEEKKWVKFDEPQALTISLITRQCVSVLDSANCEEIKTVPFSDYVLARENCRQDPINCPFFIGGEYDLFDVSVDVAGGIIMVEKYVP